MNAAEEPLDPSTVSGDTAAILVRLRALLFRVRCRVKSWPAGWRHREPLNEQLSFGLPGEAAIAEEDRGKQGRVLPD